MRQSKNVSFSNAKRKVQHADYAARRKKMQQIKKLPVKFLIISICLALFSLLIYILTKAHDTFVDKYYTDGLFKIINLPLKAFVSLFPFSVSEILLYIAIVFFIAYFIIALITSIKNHRRHLIKSFFPLAKYACILLCTICLLYTSYVWFGGLNYNSRSFADKAGYTITQSSKEELVSLCRYLGDQAGNARAKLSEDANGVITTSYSFKDLSQKATDGYKKLSETYPYLNGYYPNTKPVIFSLAMCYEQISGIYPYIIPEPQINVKTPVYSLPSTICHEMAHQRAFSLEDEANFISYLACINNSDPLFVYSGYYLAFTHSMNQLYTVDNEAWIVIRNSVDAGIYRDIQNDNDFWNSFETPNDIIATVSNSANNVFLKSNNVDDGVKSYGRVVDLLLAEYKRITDKSY